MPSLLAPVVDDRTTVVEAPYRYVTTRVVVEEATTWDWHGHLDAELLWVERGHVDTWTPGVAWTAVRGLALAIAPGTRHRVRTYGPAALSCTYARAAHWPTRVVRLDETTCALLRHLEAHDMPDPERLRAEAVVTDLLSREAVGPVDVQVPRHSAARVVAERLLADPADSRSLADWASSVGTSERTLARAFTAEVGHSFGRWRIDLRIRHATRLLAEGTPVAAVTQRVGYSSASAFCAAYLRVTGRTPGEAAAEPSPPAPTPLRPAWAGTTATPTAS